MSRSASSPPPTRAAAALTRVASRVVDLSIGTDPGWLRLQLAGRTTITLAVTLGVMYLLTSWAGAPFTVALLGVVISMMIAMAVNEPDPLQRLVTTALLPLPAGATVTLGAVLAGRTVLADGTFVVIMVGATLARRFGGRGMAMGMAAFMTYFFALFLGATLAQLPWLIGAIVLGAAISYLMRTFVLPDRPERVLRRTLRAVLVRVADLVEATADGVRDGRADDAARARLRHQAQRLNETVTMAQNQLSGTVRASALRPGLSEQELTFQLFDVELAAERLVEAGTRTAGSASMAAQDRAAVLDGLRATLRDRSAARPLTKGQRGLQRPGAPAVLPRPAAPSSGDGGPLEPDPPSQLRLAAGHLAAVSAGLLELLEGAGGERAADDDGQAPPEQDQQDERSPEESEESEGSEESGSPGLSPLTRQAVQVGVAAAAAVVVGELVSPARWYWAAIATFVIFIGTTSRGEVLTKGWQRLLGTAAGVPAGLLIATVAGGDTVLSLVLVFVCIFLAFYLIQVAYGWMIFWITAMLALLYGLMGQFSLSLLVVRLEETAVGAVIGMLVAATVLPIRTRSVIADSARDFLGSLRRLLENALPPAGQEPPQAAEPGGGLVGDGQELHQKLEQLRGAATPVTSGIAGQLRGRGSARRFLQLTAVCDHYARSLARVGNDAGPSLDPREGEAPAPKMTAAVRRIADNVSALQTALDEPGEAEVQGAARLLDSAETVLAVDFHGQPESTPSLTTVRSLRHIDRAVLDLARQLGAHVVPDRAESNEARPAVGTRSGSS